MILLVLDQSTSCSGWSASKNGVHLSHGTFVVDTKKYDIDKRIDMMYTYVREKIVQEKVDCLCFEETSLNRIQNVNVFKWLCRLQGHLMCLAHEFNIECKLIYANEWRSALGFLKGKKKAETTRECMKACAIEFANKEYGLNLKKSEDDLAEALSLEKAFWILKNNS